MKSTKVLGVILTFVFAVALMINSPVMAKADDGKMKIAYVDLAKLFDQYEKTKAFDKVLEAESNKFQEERNKKIDQIRELQSKSGMQKEAEKAKTDKEIEKLKNEVLEFDRAKRTDLTKNRDEKVREILLEIEKTVSEYSKKQGYTFVLNERVLLYGEETLNITDPILKILNDNYSKSGAPAKK